MVKIMLSKYDLCLVEAYERGYRIIDGKPHNPSGKQLCINSSDCYDRFGIRKNGKKEVIRIHKLVAYQKYGDKIFEEGIQVRHKDNNRKNNLDENILIGTQSQNMMDRKPEDRLECAKNASSHIRKFTNAEMEEIREVYAGLRSYKQVMEMFDISSKGTLHHILNHDYQTEKIGVITQRIV